MPDDHKRSGPPHDEGAATGTAGHHGKFTRPGRRPARPFGAALELVGPYVQGVLADVNVIVDKAAARAREIPDQPELARQVAAAWQVIGELLTRVAVLEYDLQERDAERQRQRRRRERTGAA